MTETPEYLKVDEVAKRCRVKSSTVRRWIKLGIMPAVKVGRPWLVSRADLEDKLEVER